MQRLVKNQYEAIAKTINETWFTVEVDSLIHRLADLFAESDPEFKKDVFLKECGL